VAAYTSIENLAILPDIAIGSDDAVRSILLVSKVPLEQIHAVALDSSSRSSAALIQVLFARYWKREARFVSAEPQLDKMLANSDAALLIGDPALKVDRSRYLTWDLAHEWRTFTGKPFVFAFWAVRAGAASEDELAYVAEVFRASRDAGLTHLPEIATEWSTNLNLTPEFITSYLAENIQYRLHAGNLAGMQLFFEFAAELRVLPPAPELRFAREFEIRNSALRNRF
jgi:chorismate dehydratase